MRFLIVDDFDTMIRIIKNVLGELGYDDVVTARNGEQAYQILSKEKIDFIISDWNMPNMTGIELLKAVRADAEISATPFLMVTAEALQDNVIAAVKAGVSNYIVKPFTAETLDEKIAKIIEKLG